MASLACTLSSRIMPAWPSAKQSAAHMYWQAPLRRGAQIPLSKTSATSAKMAVTTSSCAMPLCAGGWSTPRARVSHASPQAFGFATFVPRPQCHILMRIVQARSKKFKVWKWCKEWSAVAFSTVLGLRSEVWRRFDEGHSSELSSNGTILVVTRRDRTWRYAPGAMAASSQWRPGRWRARLGSDGSVSTIKYRAESALAMLGIEGARRQRERA